MIACDTVKLKNSWSRANTLVCYCNFRSKMGVITACELSYSFSRAIILVTKADVQLSLITATSIF